MLALAPLAALHINTAPSFFLSTFLPPLLLFIHRPPIRPSASPTRPVSHPPALPFPFSHSSRRQLFLRSPHITPDPYPKMPPKAAAEKKPATKAPASKAPAEKKEAGKKTAASGDKKKRTKTRKETYSSYIYKGTTLPLWESRPFASIDRVNNVTSRSPLASNL